MAVVESSDPLDQAQALLRSSLPAIGAGAGPRGEAAEGAAILCHPALLTLECERALALELSLLALLCRAPRATLWLAGVTGNLTPVAHHGSESPSDDGRLAAARVVQRGDGPVVDGVAGAAVRRSGATQGAVIVEDAGASQEVVAACARTAAEMAGAMLDREILLARRTRGEEALVQSSEREVTGIMLDLHDGPLQDLAALGGEIQALRTDCLGEGLPTGALDGRLDDLHAWVRAIDADVRRLSAGAGAPLLLRGAFEELLRQLTDGFTARSGVAARVEVDGPVNALRDAQRVGVLRIIQQALANVRQHAEAGRVTVTVRLADDHLTASVEDDGMGFDAETMLKAGPTTDGHHQGLTGMRERARLLGGYLRVMSRPGGPTTITLRLPAPQNSPVLPVWGSEQAELVVTG